VLFMRTVIVLILLVAGVIYMVDYLFIKENFQKLIDEHPSTKYSPMLQKFLCDIYYFFGDNKRTAKTCEIFLKKYPDNRDALEIMFRLATAYEGLDERTKAIELYKIIVATAPQTSYGNIAARRLEYIR